MAMQPTQGELNPDYVAKAEFNLSRRGYEPAEVRALLREVARNLAVLHRREAELHQRLNDAEAAVPAPMTVDDLDETDLTAVLGEKTTQVLQAAREAAADIHQRSVDKARTLVDQATQDAQRIRAESESTLRTARDRAEDMERKAEQRSKQLTHSAESELSKAKVDAEAMLHNARARAGDIEAEAEATAAAISESAEEAAARARAKAETLVITARAQAEQLESEAQTRAALLTRETEERVAAVRAEAEADFASRTEGAEAEADRILREAARRATTDEEAGREAGRQLVGTAMRAREQVLRVLAKRRRAAQVQIGQLRVGRERLLEAYAVVRATADQATEELGDVLSEAKLAAEAVADEVGNEEEMTLEQLEAAFGLDRITDVAILREPATAEDEVEESATGPEDADDATEQPVDEAAPDQATAEAGAGDDPTDPVVIEDDVTDAVDDTAEVDEPAGERSEELSPASHGR